MSAKIVDSIEFCKQQQSLSGSTTLVDFTRLSAELVGQEGKLDWTVTGGRHPAGLPTMSLAINGEVVLVCQRCLSPMRHRLASASTLILARDEADADDTEARLDDDSVDVIVGSASMDLMLLIEDEALLALPLSPRHEGCPGELPAADAEKAESPFAVLKKLR